MSSVQEEERRWWVPGWEGSEEGLIKAEGLSWLGKSRARRNHVTLLTTQP